MGQRQEQIRNHSITQMQTQEPHAPLCILFNLPPLHQVSSIGTSNLKFKVYVRKFYYAIGLNAQLK